MVELKFNIKIGMPYCIYYWLFVYLVSDARHQTQPLTCVGQVLCHCTLALTQDREILKSWYQLSVSIHQILNLFLLPSNIPYLHKYTPNLVSVYYKNSCVIV